MIFTFGAPDLYVLPSDISSSTHPQKESQESGSLDPHEDQDILSIRISYCNSYIFILTKRVLFAYSNGNELVYLGRLTLSEAGFSEFGNFRDLVILPVSNLFGLLVDNAKHLLVVNYQNPNLSETSLPNTPVQTPTNRALYNNSSFNSENSLNSEHSPKHIGPTPLTTTPITTVDGNKRFSTGNLVNILNRIFRPSDNEVEELRDSFDLYLKNFVKFRLIYDVLVPSNFSFMFIVDQQFVFWTKEFSGLYSTISKEGFLNLLINDFNTFKRKPDEVKRISLYLLTTNLLNNVNIIGNIPLSYGLCYINLQSVTINRSKLLRVDLKEVYGDEGNENQGMFYRDLKLFNENDSLFQMIYQCISNIHNTDPNYMVSISSNKDDNNKDNNKDKEKQEDNNNNDINNNKQDNNNKDSLERKSSVDAENILDLLEVQNKSIDRSMVDSDMCRVGGVEENLVKSVKSHFIVDNKLYLLSSNLLIYIHIHSPEYYENDQTQCDFNDDNNKQNSSINSFVTACSEYKEDDKTLKKVELGRLVYEDVEEVYVNKEYELICVLFKGNKIRTFYLKRLDRVISELEFEEEVEDVCWSNNFLIVLTVDNYLNFYSYSLQKLYSTPVDPSKRGTNQRYETGIRPIRTFSNLTGTNSTISESCSTYRSVVSTNSNDNDTNNNKDNREENNKRNEDKEKREGNEEYNKHFKKGRLLGINNNLKLLVYNRRLVVYNLYVNHSNVSGFNLFLNSNNILIISSSSFFSPTKSFGTTFNTNLSKDKRQMYTLKLPNLNASEVEDSESVDEDQPCSIDDLIIKDIKINKTANYILIHHARSSAPGVNGSKSTSGIILYDNNRYTFSKDNNVDVLSINWFTNHIFYLVVRLKNDKHMAGKHTVERKKITFKYYVSFYSINNMNDVLIEIPMKHKPVCTTTDNPYLFVALDDSNKLHCYDLFYIQYKMLYLFDINELSWYGNLNNMVSISSNKDDNDTSNNKQDNNNKDNMEKTNRFNVNDHGEYWREIYVFGFKKFLLLDLYRELYLIDEHKIAHLLSNVNQVVFNVSDSSNYQYLVTTRDGKSYLLSNFSENVISREYNTNNNKRNEDKEERENNNNKDNQDKERNSKKNVFNSVVRKSKTSRPMFVMEVIRLMNNTNYILNINNDVIVLLNLTKNNISLIYTLLPVFLTNNNTNKDNNNKDSSKDTEKDNDKNNRNSRLGNNSSNNTNGFEGQQKYVNEEAQNQLRGREMLLLEYLIYYFNLLGKEGFDKDNNDNDHSKNKDNKEEDYGEKKLSKENQEDNNNTNNDKDSNAENKNKQHDIRNIRIKEMMCNINKMMKNKLFSISCRKQNELDKVIQLEKEFDLKSEESFNYLLEAKEFEFASLLLLPLQIKTDPYYVRTNFCKNLIKELLSSIIHSTPQTGFKSRRNYQVLILMLIKFYNRLPMGDEDNRKLNNTNKNNENHNSEDRNMDHSDNRDQEKNNNNKEERENKQIKDNQDEEQKLDEELMYKIRTQGFGKGIDMVIDMDELIKDLLLKLNFIPVYQLNFLDYKNKDNKNNKYNHNSNINKDNKYKDETTCLDKENDKEPLSPNNNINYLNNELKDIVENIVKLNTDFEKLSLNIVLYFMVEANHINYDMYTTSTDRSQVFLVNKFFNEESMKFYMLLGYSNYICLSDLVVNSPYITNLMINIQESNCRTDKDPNKDRLSILKKLLIKTITTYTPYSG